jgi:hypothetical protein
LADRLSRELRDDELPENAREELEEARTAHRKTPPRERRAGGSEERPGTETAPWKRPKAEAHRPVEPPASTHEPR